MLRAIPTDPTVVAARVAALSSARLSSYRSFFSVPTDAEALGLYQWNEDLSAHLYRAIAVLEIVMRNRFHQALSRHYGVAGYPGSRDWYNHVVLNKKSKRSVQKVTHFMQGLQAIPRQPVPTPDDVVSRVTFGFWPHVLDVTVDSHNQPVQWGPILVDVLQGHRQRRAGYWSRRRQQDELFARLDLCNDLRNRIAHHEPVWKLGPLMEEGRARQNYLPRQVAPAPTTPLEALARLRLVYDRVIELLRWLSPDMAAYYVASEPHRRCLDLLQPAALHSYRQARSYTIDLATETSFRAFRKALRLAMRKGYPVLLQDGTRVLGQLVGMAV